MTTALLSNDTELLQKARRVLVGKGYWEEIAWNDNPPSEYDRIKIYQSRKIAFFSSLICSDQHIHLTPENFDSVMEGLNV